MAAVVRGPGAAPVGGAHCPARPQRPGRVRLRARHPSRPALLDPHRARPLRRPAPVPVPARPAPAGRLHGPLPGRVLRPAQPARRPLLAPGTAGGGPGLAGAGTLGGARLAALGAVHRLSLDGPRLRPLRPAAAHPERGPGRPPPGHLRGGALQQPAGRHHRPPAARRALERAPGARPAAPGLRHPGLPLRLFDGALPDRGPVRAAGPAGPGGGGPGQRRPGGQVVARLQNRHHRHLPAPVREGDRRHGRRTGGLAGDRPALLPAAGPAHRPTDRLHRGGQHLAAHRRAAVHPHPADRRRRAGASLQRRHPARPGRPPRGQPRQAAPGAVRRVRAPAALPALSRTAGGERRRLHRRHLERAAGARADAAGPAHLL